MRCRNADRSTTIGGVTNRDDAGRNRRRNGPSGSSLVASARAFSNRGWMMALIVGLIASARPMAASTNSNGVASPLRTS